MHQLRKLRTEILALVREGFGAPLLQDKMAGNKATADENIAALSTESIQKMAAVNNIT